MLWPLISEFIFSDCYYSVIPKLYSIVVRALYRYADIGKISTVIIRFQFILGYSQTLQELLHAVDCFDTLNDCMLAGKFHLLPLQPVPPGRFLHLLLGIFSCFFGMILRFFNHISMFFHCKFKNSRFFLKNTPPINIYRSSWNIAK